MNETIVAPIYITFAPNKCLSMNLLYCFIKYSGLHLIQP